jgi:hypothetical protein
MYRHLILILVLMSVALAGNSTTEGGNVTGADLDSSPGSAWHGVAGNVGGAAFVPFSFVADAGNISYFDINTGFNSCEGGEYDILNILFSNSSAAITSLVRGNLSVFDNFVLSSQENGTDTFVFSTTFTTAGYGNITGVPTTYTNSPVPNTFRMGYLQDQGGDLVIIVPVVDNQVGFNGSTFDFQLMVPTMNRTNVTYYVTIDLQCTGEEPPEPPYKPPGGGGGGGVPVYNESRKPPEVPGQNGTPPGVPPRCDIVLFCEEWGNCIDGYRYQKCTDYNECTNTTVYRVEECLPAAPEEPIEAISKELIPVRVKQELPCIIPIVLILTILLILLLLYYRRRKGEEEKGRRGIPK